MTGSAGSGVLANAVINIIGNVSGMRSAMRETQTQLWGLMTLSGRIGGAVSQNLINPIAARIGMGKIFAAQTAAKLDYDYQKRMHAANEPQKPTHPRDMNFMGPMSPTQLATAMYNYRQGMKQYKEDMRAWRASGPNQRAISDKHVQSAALFAGKVDFAISAVIGLGRVLVDAANYASQFREELNKMVQTFGKSSDAVLSNIKSQGSFGIDRTAMLSAVSTIGIELMGAGISEAIASQMATAMAKRAIDMTSYYNLKGDEDALRKVVSGLAGMGRPLKELGVILNEARVETYALTHGLWDGKHEFSEAAKVQASYGLIMQETRRAEGDRLRTMYDLENQYRGISGNWSNLMTTIGNTKPIQWATMAINDFLVKTEEIVRALNIFGQLSDWFTDSAADAAQKSEVSKQNRFAADRVYADEIIADAKKAGSDRKNARHTSLEGFAKGLQEGVFNDSGKMLVDLTRVLVGLTEVQVEALKKVAPTLKAYTADNAPQGSW